MSSDAHQANENGLRGRSGERGLNALAKSSSPDSVLVVRTRGAIESRDAKPLGSLCWNSWRDSGGNCATARRGSAVAVLGVGVVFVSGVGMECMGLEMILLNELNDETATSGDWGDSRLPGLGSIWFG